MRAVVHFALGANLRVDDNTALCAALEHFLSVGGCLAPVATRAAAEAHPEALRDLDASLRARGSRLLLVDDVVRFAECVGDARTLVFASPAVEGAAGERALLSAGKARVRVCAQTPEDCEPREAPRWLPPPLPPSLLSHAVPFGDGERCRRRAVPPLGHSRARVPAASESRAAAACAERAQPGRPRSESEARAQLAKRVRHARHWCELQSAVWRAVSAGLLSRARVRRAWQRRAKRVERLQAGVVAAGVAASVGARFLLDTAHSADAHAIHDVNGSHKRELRWDAARRRYVFREHTGSRDYEIEMRGFFGRKWAWVKQSFLPEGVTDDYYAFARWRLFQRLMSSTVGVFGTQALLLALGIKSGNKISQAATISWVLKDGLSRVGKMLWASQLGRDMDADPKRFRFYSALLYSLGNGLEIMTRLVPQSFLLLATVANTAKLCSMLTASATRNSMYRSFAGRNENIADITAKGEAQITIADIGGMAMGIQLSKLIGTSRPNVVATFAVLSAIDLFAIWQELRVVEFRTLNLQRSCLVVEQYLHDGTVPSPKEASKRERILLPEPLPRQAFKPLPRLVQNEEQMHEVMRRYKGERFLLRDHGIVLRDDAKPSDIFRAIVAWTLIQRGYASEEDAPARMRAVVEPLLDTAKASGWRTFVYPRFKRRASW